MNIFESNIILWIQENVRGPVGNVFWQIITRLGDDGIMWIVLGLVLVCIKKTRVVGVTVLLSLLLDFLVVNVTLKTLIARPRPFVVNEAIKPLVLNVVEYCSFPSGHAASSFAAAFALQRYLPKKWGITALFVATLIGISRLYVGVHYPTDILCGMVIGFLCSVAAYNLVEMGIKKYRRKKIDG